ncbi:class I SAM-dependent methyltransferase [Occultella glacieicola]|uniref:class I SAM-dependent methyltransferase n=1 Tax=Occultella glacieicola TaxID=2518684 RepID=UPI001A9F2C89|nr:class I SAM-dependent methyltransferase [Occultella glacieicola]
MDAPSRTALLAPLTGAVLEIGAGDGANLASFGPDVSWCGIEPDRRRRNRLLARADGLGMDVQVDDGFAEHLEAPDASVDAVVSTTVLCTVQDPTAALAEVRRVLVPGGRFVFWEHVAAPAWTPVRVAQELWSWRAPDGCRANRDTLTSIRAAGFADVQVSTFTQPGPLGLAIPFIAGHATT